MHERQLVLFFQRQCMVIGVGVGLAKQHDLAATRLDRFDLDWRCRGRHHDHCAATELAGRQRDPLRVIAGRCADHAVFKLRRRQVCHLVVRAAQLEAEHALHVFALEINLVFHALGEDRRKLKRRFDGDVVDAGGQDFLQVVGGHGFGCLVISRNGTPTCYPLKRMQDRMRTMCVFSRSL